MYTLCTNINVMIIVDVRIRCIVNQNGRRLWVRFRFLNGRCFVSSIDCLMLLLLRQFPCESSNHMFPTNRSVSLFFTNCMMVGFSLVAPHCLCIPKYFSRGSWQILLLKKQVTPGILKIASTSSTKEQTV